MPDGNPLPPITFRRVRNLRPQLCKRDGPICYCCQRTVAAGETIWRSHPPAVWHLQLCHHCAIAVNLQHGPIGQLNPEHVEPYGGGPPPAPQLVPPGQGLALPKRRYNRATPPPIVEPGATSRPDFPPTTRKPPSDAPLPFTK